MVHQVISGRNFERINSPLLPLFEMSETVEAVDETLQFWETMSMLQYMVQYLNVYCSDVLILLVTQKSEPEKSRETSQSWEMQDQANCFRFSVLT